MTKILIIGAEGQLGQCLKEVAEKRGTPVILPSEQYANVLNSSLLIALFEKEKPNYVINCAAYTAVDKAEEEQDQAKAVNETGAMNLANSCLQFGATLIHISTDFVFKGDTVKLLAEDDFAEPINVYGRTKLDGELIIASILKEFYILRTSWLYSEYANNFVKTMLKLGREREELSIIADQIGSPTYAIDLANAIFDIISLDKKVYGTYHYSNEGAISWYDFAVAIFQLADVNVRLNPIPSNAYPTKAKRPSFSVMDKSKIKSTFSLAVPYWRESLERCVFKIKEQA